MKRILYNLLISAFLPQLAAAAVDLSPRYIDVFAEGVTIRRAYFTDGDKKFLVSLNRETEVTADAGGARFNFLKLPEATFLAIRSRHSPEEKFEGPALERYRESARRLLPLNSREVVIRQEVANPFPINDWTSHRIIMAFDVGAVHYLESVTFLNLNATDQIALITSAPEKDFEEAAHRSYQIFRTWQEMLPGDEKPVGGN